MHPRVKNYLIILLAFATATTAVIAWRQAQRVQDLQTELLAAKAPPTIRKVAKSLSESPFGSDDAKAKPAAEAAGAEAADAPAGDIPPKPPRNRPNLTALLANPDFAKAWNIERRAQLDNRYADLFKHLQLTPAQLESLKSLLVERDSAAMDVYAAARDKGLDPRENRDALSKLVAESQADADQSIKTALGDTAYQQYQNFQATQPQRAVVAQLNQRLSYTATPLTAVQSDFLVQALSAPAAQPATPDAPDPAPGGRGGLFGAGGGKAAISDAVIQQAQSVLTPDQVGALKEIQAQQHAQLQIGQMVRAAREKN